MLLVLLVLLVLLARLALLLTALCVTSRMSAPPLPLPLQRCFDSVPQRRHHFRSYRFKQHIQGHSSVAAVAVVLVLFVLVTNAATAKGRRLSLLLPSPPRDGWSSGIFGGSSNPIGWWCR